MTIIANPPTMTNSIEPTSKSELIQVHTLPLDQNPAAVFLGGYPEATRRTYQQALDVIAGILTNNADALACNWGAVRFSHAKRIRRLLLDSYSPATVNKFLSALRGVAETAWLLEQMPDKDFMKITKGIKGIKSETLPTGRELEPGELLALMRACENDLSPAGPRDAAMIACMYPGGLRRSEVVALDFDDYNQDTGEVKVRRGKGRKDRITYVANGAGRAMSDWLALRGDEPGPLFYPIRKSKIDKDGKLINSGAIVKERKDPETGEMKQARMTNQAIYNMLQKRGEEAKIKDFTPHDLRRTFVSHALAAGADIAIVAKMAGHANVQTTARYDRRPEEAKRKAAGLLHLPYTGRMV